MSISTNELFEMLNWNNSIEMQEKGIREAEKVKYISIFFQPKESKALWENCAKVIVQKSDDELSPFVMDMLIWLQDMNWPGAELIYKRIKLMPSTLVCHNFSYCLKIAIQTEDNPWIGSLRSFANDYGLLNLLPEEQRAFLQKPN